MKTFLLVNAFILISLLHPRAQDIIITTEGSEIEVKVEEINSTAVKYKKYKMPDGPTYEISKKDVFMIKYATGQTDKFNTWSQNSLTSDVPGSPPKRATVPKKGADKKNAIGTSPLLLVLDISTALGALEYERRINGPFTIGVRILRWEKSSYRYWEDATGGGVLFRRYFNNNQGLNGFFIGSAIDILSLEWGESSGEGTSWEYEYGTGIALAISSQLGYKLGLGKSFYIEPSLSVGFYGSSTSSSYDSYNENGTVIAPLLTVGFRF